MVEDRPQQLALAQGPAREADAPTPRPRGRPAHRAIAAQPAFAPLIGLWGAALGGLSAIVLPLSTTARIAEFARLGAFGAFVHYVLAAITALIVGALAFGIALVLSRMARSRGPCGSVAAMARMRPLRPVEDLGSASFDAPIEEMPLGMKAEDWFDRDDPQDKSREEAAETATASIRRRLARTIEEVEAAAPLAPTEPAAPEETAPPPQEMDLSDFGALPGRNAVWFEGPLPDGLGEQDEPAPAPAETPALEAPKPSPPAAPAPQRRNKSAIELLRETPAEDLSLVAMVERLAAALHERQSAENAPGPAELLGGGREAVLAEALKALSVLADGPHAESRGPENGEAPTPASADLAAALAKLHDLRGAA